MLKYKTMVCVEKIFAAQKFQYLQSACVEILGRNNCKIVVDVSKQRSASIVRVSPKSVIICHLTEYNSLEEQCFHQHFHDTLKFWFFRVIGLKIDTYVSNMRCLMC
jgi:hypothetical protein